ncbi:hypothetical protein [Dyadobacter aurulentus]|uniref:hypothetical protein n=1 Tax=Dyadobacter sp. UC 10 TaxID=2605428 RepID=UPI0011F2B056|nr:hypothetical protein [Dyadobacter sp. UC 10]KAA0993804.1 hypothetical protein FXO21_28295 [Dyadobacter sp. UC 10]
MKRVLLFVLLIFFTNIPKCLAEEVNASVCHAGNAQVLVDATLTNECLKPAANLKDALNSVIPAGNGNNELVWYTNSHHTGSPVSSPSQVGAGTYYAFIYDAVNDCFNTGTSTAKVDVTINPIPNNGQQVALAKTTVTNICPSPTAFLGNIFSGVPPADCDLVFNTKSDLSGDFIFDGKTNVSGTYYAFWKNNNYWFNGCYNTANSTAKVVVTINAVPLNGLVQLSKTSLTNACPKTTVNLNDAVSSSIPCTGGKIRWYHSNKHFGSPVQDPANVVAGEYWAFYTNAAEDAFGTETSTAKVTVTINNCPPPCDAGTAQVPLIKTSMANVCPTKTVNLSEAFGGTVPTGAFLYWYDNATHSGNPVANINAVGGGTYYAFYRDLTNNCFNTNLSTAKVTVTSIRCQCAAGTDQVTLKKNVVETVCPATTANLNKVVAVIAPLGSKVVWYNNPNHEGSPQTNPEVSPAGSYWAFFYDVDDDCYNTALSSAKVTVTLTDCSVCNAGTAQVDVVGGPNSFYITTCKPYKDLTEYQIASVPAGTSVVWFKDPNHVNPVADPTMAPVGSYYAFYYDEIHNCFNTDNSTVQVTVNQIPSLSKTNLTGICPANTANLNDAVSEQGLELVWFTNNSHSGEPVADPFHAGAGTYYGFYGDAATGCYNVDISTTPVTVTINNCPINEADLTQTVVINALNFNSEASRDFVVNLYEINGFDTKAPINFKISKTGSFDITYPTVSGTSQVLGGTPNENSNWTFSENASFITVTSTSTIPANGQATIGFKVSRKPGVLKGSKQSITVTLVGGSGGELNAGNNLSVTAISTN